MLTFPESHIFPVRTQSTTSGGEDDLIAHNVRELRAEEESLHRLLTHFLERPYIVLKAVRVISRFLLRCTERSGVRSQSFAQLQRRVTLFQVSSGRMKCIAELNITLCHLCFQAHVRRNILRKKLLHKCKLDTLFSIIDAYSKAWMVRKRFILMKQSCAMLEICSRRTIAWLRTQTDIAKEACVFLQAICQRMVALQKRQR